MNLQILENNDLVRGNGFVARTHAGHIDVWSADGERYLGSTPLDFTLTQIEVAVRFFYEGKKAGKELDI